MLAGSAIHVLPYDLGVLASAFGSPVAFLPASVGFVFPAAGFGFAASVRCAEFLLYL
jgi:hypothetical protein